MIRNRGKCLLVLGIALESVVSLVGQAWKSMDWFGHFAEYPENWIYHIEHGFLNFNGDDTSDYYWYDAKTESWFWTSSNTYPFLYKFGQNQGWHYYQLGARLGKRWFYNLTNGNPVHESKLNLTHVSNGFDLILGGTFMMGSPEEEPGRDPDENQHEVTLTRDFYLQRTEVTNLQMATAMNWAMGQGLISVTSISVKNTEGNPFELLDLDDPDSQISFDGSEFVVDEGKEYYPVQEVTWYGALAYCNFLSDLEGLDRAIDFVSGTYYFNTEGYRLPTEAEWEFACRAGTETRFYTGTTIAEFALAAWYKDNSGDGTHEVGLKQPNNWGLYDMHGNLYEWCWDLYGAYPSSPLINPIGPSNGISRIIRGGAWSYSAGHACRSANRGYSPPGYIPPEVSDMPVGFRLARTIIAQQ